MYRVLLVADKAEQVREISLGLAERGFLCSIVSGEDDSLKDVRSLPADMIVVVINGASPGSGIWLLPEKLKNQTSQPVIALLSKQSLDIFDPDSPVDDFVVAPWSTSEVAARARHVLQRNAKADSKDTLKCGNLKIDPAKCEVTFRGRIVDLTFREYELLRFLVENKGIVFSRETLLNKVWEYDYYGGDRTVDVHIRRLRGKLDDSDCIETVRNIGYRCKDDD